MNGALRGGSDEGGPGDMRQDGAVHGNPVDTVPKNDSEHRQREEDGPEAARPDDEQEEPTTGDVLGTTEVRNGSENREGWHEDRKGTKWKRGHHEPKEEVFAALRQDHIIGEVDGPRATRNRSRQPSVATTHPTPAPPITRPSRKKRQSSQAPQQVSRAGSQASSRANSVVAMTGVRAGSMAPPRNPRPSFPSMAGYNASQSDSTASEALSPDGGPLTSWISSVDGGTGIGQSTQSSRRESLAAANNFRQAHATAEPGLQFERIAEEDDEDHEE